MSIKKLKKKVKKISIALPERDGEVLKRCAKDAGVSCPVMAKRLLKEALKQHRNNHQKEEPRNQLGLFDTIQVDIFNNTSKVSNKME
jgi:hypothetical protein